MGASLGHVTGRHCGDRALHPAHTWRGPRFDVLACGGTVPDDRPDEPTCPHQLDGCRCDGAAHSVSGGLPR